MEIPFFYVDRPLHAGAELDLPEDSSRHIGQVLRMQAGELLFLTDGQGNGAEAVIAHSTKKNTRVRLLTVTYTPKSESRIYVAVSLLKTAARWEWLLEKCMEAGVNGIIPLICQRTEKQHYRTERSRNLLVSALQQSRQHWLPELPEPVPLPRFLQEIGPGATMPASNEELTPLVRDLQACRKAIAHCMAGEKKAYRDWLPGSGRVLLLIGPEGDFTKQELELALAAGCEPVSLGSTRLRTETAAMLAAGMACLTIR